MERFQQWLKEKCEEQNLSWREASMKAGLNPGFISAVMIGQKPGFESCKALAKLFHVSPVFVLQLAGHLEESITNSPGFDRIMLDPLLQEFIAAWPDLDLDQRRAFVHLAKKGKILKAKRERGEA